MMKTHPLAAAAILAAGDLGCHTLAARTAKPEPENRVTQAVPVPQPDPVAAPGKTVVRSYVDSFEEKWNEMDLSRLDVDELTTGWTEGEPRTLDPARYYYPMSELPEVPDGHWGLDAERLADVLAATAKLAEPDPGPTNPRWVKGFSYAALEMTEEIDHWIIDHGIYRTRLLLQEQKVPTAAQAMYFVTPVDLDLMIFRWEIGIPVAEGTVLKPPLVLKKASSSRAWVRNFTMRDHYIRDHILSGRHDRRLADDVVQEVIDAGYFAWDEGKKQEVTMWFRWTDEGIVPYMEPDFRYQIIFPIHVGPGESCTGADRGEPEHPAM